jgi:Tfp pilus assembly protein PilF
MLKRTIIVMSLAVTLALAFQPLQSVNSMLITDAELTIMNPTQANGQEKSGSRFVRALKAPFRAIGRLFGRGRKDENKLERLSEKDAKKFEAAQLTRIVDARSPIIPKDPALSSVETLSDSMDLGKELALLRAERGRQLLNSGEVNEAISELSLATWYDPELKDAHNLLGVAYGTKGMRNLAISSFKRSLKGDNDSAEHLNNFGYFLYQIGELEEATKYLKKAVKRDPNNERYWNNLALAQAQRGKFDDAHKSFVKASGEFEGRLNLATRLQRLGQDKEAIKHLEEAHKLRPTSEETLSQLITLYERAGQSEQATEMRNTLVGLRATAKSNGTVVTGSEQEK